jgi:hypothetical protein
MHSGAVMHGILAVRSQLTLKEWLDPPAEQSWCLICPGIRQTALMIPCSFGLR